MKTLSLCLIVLCILCLVMPASAQPRIGVIGGLNLANVRSPDTNDLDSRRRTVFGLGGMLEVGLGRWVTLSVEPMYLQKGPHLSEGFENEEGMLKMSYLEVPVLLKLSLRASPTRPYLVVGPTIGFLRSAKLSDGSNKFDIKSSVNDRDVSLIVGAGLRVPAGKVAMFVEGRYAYGLVNIFKESVTDVMSKSMQVMAGITVPLGR